MEIFIGTSGWLYDWNIDGTLNWYLQNSRLNAIELNASFYRFPFRNQVSSWAKKTSIYGIRWAVKVFRGITHYRKLSYKAIDIWRKFYELFTPLDMYIDFYLFQMPPNFVASDENIEKLKQFAKIVALGERLAIEFRHNSWFTINVIDQLKKFNATIVSIDSPIGRWIVSSNNIVYMRLHGSYTWYAYEYSYEELEDIARRIVELNPKKIYVFFNNDHWMLENARTMMSILTRINKI